MPKSLKGFFHHADINKTLSDLSDHGASIPSFFGKRFGATQSRDD
jgi:hypothetical protein